MRWLKNVALLVVTAVVCGLVLGLASPLIERDASYDSPVAEALVNGLAGAWLALVFAVVIVPVVLLGLAAIEFAARKGVRTSTLRAIAVSLAGGLGLGLALDADGVGLAAAFIVGGFTYGALLRLPPPRGLHWPAAEASATGSAAT